MKISACLLPADGAALLEAVIPMLQAIEDAPDEDTRAERHAQARAWLVETAVALRKADGRGKPQTPPMGQPGPVAGVPKPVPEKKAGRPPCSYCGEEFSPWPSVNPANPTMHNSCAELSRRFAGPSPVEQRAALRQLRDTKHPCDCEDKSDRDPKQPTRGQAPEPFVPPEPSIGRLLGEAFASKVLAHLDIPFMKGPK